MLIQLFSCMVRFFLLFQVKIGLMTFPEFPTFSDISKHHSDSYSVICENPPRLANYSFSEVKIKMRIK